MEQREDGPSQSEPKYFSIDHGIGRLLESARRAVVDEVLKKWARRTTILVGEVISIRPRGDRLYIRLRATTDPEVAFDAIVPFALRPRPEAGDMLRLEGTFRAMTTDCAVELQFEAKRYAEPPTKAAKYWAWQREYDQLRAEFPTPVQPVRPIQRIAVLTGRNTHGWFDFISGLGNLRDREEVEVVHHHIPLESGEPKDTASAILAVLGLGGIDMLAIVRGGGQTEKLQRFSNPVVVRAVAQVAATVPTIVAIGHDRDEVVAEEFAFETASAPSVAGKKAASWIRTTRKRAAEAAAKAVNRSVARGSVGPLPALHASAAALPAAVNTSLRPAIPAATRSVEPLGVAGPAFDRPPARRTRSLAAKAALISAVVLALIAAAWFVAHTFGANSNSLREVHNASMPSGPQLVETAVETLPDAGPQTKKRAKPSRSTSRVRPGGATEGGTQQVPGR